MDYRDRHGLTPAEKARHPQIDKAMEDPAWIETMGAAIMVLLALSSIAAVIVQAIMALGR